MLKAKGMDFILEALKSDFVDSSKGWRIFNKMRRGASSAPVHLSTLKNHFSQVYFNSSEPLAYLPFGESRFGPMNQIDDEVNGPILISELHFALQNFNRKAASGPDRISTIDFFKVFNDQDSLCDLCVFFNQCFFNGVVPSSWAKAEVFTLFKGKGSASNPGNYRGINLLDNACRLNDRLLRNRLFKSAIHYDLFTPFQLGFQPGLCTWDGSISLFTFLKTRVAVKHEKFVGIFLDLKKAFPSVNCRKLLDLLYKLECPSKLLNAISSLVSFNECRFKVNNFLSTPFDVNSGTREGGITSPNLFSIVFCFILKNLGVDLLADLYSSNFSSVAAIAYADDLVLLSKNVTALQIVLDRFANLTSRFGLKINVQKTLLMPFAFIDTDSLPNFYIYDTIIASTSEFPYLSWYLNPNLNSSSHVKEIKQKIFTSVYGTSNLLCRLELTNIGRSVLLFCSLVQSQAFGIEFLPWAAMGPLFLQAWWEYFKNFFCLPASFPNAVSEYFLYSFYNPEVFVLCRRMSLWLHAMSFGSQPQHGMSTSGALANDIPFWDSITSPLCYNFTNLFSDVVLGDSLFYDFQASSAGLEEAVGRRN